MSADVLTGSPAPAVRRRRTGAAGSLPRTGWLAAAAIVVCAFAAIGLIGDVVAPAPQGPASSSYATAPTGVAAWAELLRRAGHPVRQLRSPVGSASLGPGSTLVVLGARRLPAADARGIGRFVRAGGRLVIGGGDPRATLPALLRDPPAWTASGTRLARALGTAPELAGVRTVDTAGEGAFGGGGRPLLGDPPAGSLLLVRTLGRGRIDLLADASPLQNRLLSSADNAQLSIGLAGGGERPVVFDETLHGFGAATGLAALPARWWLALAGLALAAAAWALARGRRLGPAEPPPEATQPARSAYVEAMAATLSRARDPGAVAELARTASAGEQARGSSRPA